MTRADRIAEVEKLDGLLLRQLALAADDTLSPHARWIVERDLQATRDRLEHARQQVTP